LGDGEGCRASERQELLLQYAFGGCSDEQEIAFEAHLLACDLCFDDLKALERTRDLIERFVLSEPPLLRHARARRRRNRSMLWLCVVLALGLGILIGIVV
jgi:hypothetical protein